MASEKVQAIIDSIAALTALEMSELVDCLPGLGEIVIKNLGNPQPAVATSLGQRYINNFTNYDVYLVDVTKNSALGVYQAFKELSELKDEEIREIIDTCLNDGSVMIFDGPGDEVRDFIDAFELHSGHHGLLEAWEQV